MIRRWSLKISALLFALLPTLAGCAKNSFFNAGFDYGVSVHFIDVGDGDCIYITLPDGKNMLIDCGRDNPTYFNRISGLIKESGKNRIDYLVLTHTDNGHIGGAAAIIERFAVDNAYIPEVRYTELYRSFESAKLALSNCSAKIKISSAFTGITGGDYKIYFLSPLDPDAIDSAYTEFNALPAPEIAAIDNTSAVVYLEYAGVRFLFSADAGKASEEMIAYDYEAGVYDKCWGKNSVNLYNIDFYKVSRHGSKYCNTENLLSILRPRNAVISVGENYNGEPSDEALTRLEEAYPEYELYRTDMVGTVSVYVGKTGLTLVKTELKAGEKRKSDS